MSTCPCGSSHDYSACCGRFITGDATPATAEELMRSRYTAYTQANMDYVQQTMKSPAADHFDKNSARTFAERVKWLKLDVIKTWGDAQKAFVEFGAHFLQAQKRHLLHEISEFHFLDGKWFYVDGKNPALSLPIKVNHVGRNEPCLCGSGKKYKKCCGSIEITK